MGGLQYDFSDQTGLVSKSQRLIIKIGSALLVDSDTGEIRYNWLEKMADDIANLRSRNKEVYCFFRSCSIWKSSSRHSC